MNKAQIFSRISQSQKMKAKYTIIELQGTLRYPFKKKQNKKPKQTTNKNPKTNKKKNPKQIKNSLSRLTFYNISIS